MCMCAVHNSKPSDLTTKASSGPLSYAKELRGESEIEVSRWIVEYRSSRVGLQHTSSEKLKKIYPLFSEKVQYTLVNVCVRFFWDPFLSFYFYFFLLSKSRDSCCFKHWVNRYIYICIFYLRVFRV
jgi:hypothetical protein